MNGENIRHDWIDYLRFIAIFYIYLGHFGPAAGKLYPFVFTFHVPLFFFISGLLVKRARTNNDLISAIVKS
ncbi:acyltransferase family protein, partial [Enterobacter hormaechei]